MTEDKKDTPSPQTQMMVTDKMLAAARSVMKPFVPPNDQTLRMAIAAAISQTVSITPTIDTMRQAAEDVLVKRGWKPGDTMAFHSITGLMAEFGMQVYRGEVGCDYPSCGCCADAACEDAIKHHPDLGGTPPQTTEMGIDHNNGEAK